MTSSGNPGHSTLITRAAAAIAECRLLATMTEEPGRTTRRFLTEPVRQVHAHLCTRMQSLGMSVWVDALGNLRGLWSPVKASSKRLAIGSHIDTVPDAGAFDGVLGVVLALEWVRIARQQALDLAIEVIAFSEEEGVRFGIPFLGSRAIAGTFDPSQFATVDEQGIRVDEAIRNFGLDTQSINAAVLNQSVAAFIEIHIEQGPVLESENLSLAVVEGIVGQTRLVCEFSGQANHAGTTPMDHRQDALAASAEWMIAVERTAQGQLGLVATVGKIAAEPNVSNVIPSHVTVSLDVRHIDDSIRTTAVNAIVDAGQTISDRRNIGIQWTEKLVQNSVLMDADLSAELLAAVVEAGYPAKQMPSGAGHDTMIMAKRVPSAMLFLRTPGGLSHHPDENVLEEDVEAALRVGEFFLKDLAIKLRHTW